MFPDEVRKLVLTAVETNPDNIAAATAQSLAAIQALPVYNELRDQLIQRAVRDLVHQERHRLTVEVKRQSRQYGGPAHVNHADAGVATAYRSVYDNYFIGSRCLGSLFGHELIGIAEREERIADGHKENATLCRALAELVPADSAVRQCVAENRLRVLIQQAHTQGRSRSKGGAA